MSKLNIEEIEELLESEVLIGSDSIELEVIELTLNTLINYEYNIESVKLLFNDINPLFLAKLSIFLKDINFIETSKVIACELTSIISGYGWSKNFYDRIVYTIDDMPEILSYYINNKTNCDKPKFPNALKKGFSTAFDRFDNIHIFKYIGNLDVKLIDIINLVHPIPNDENKESLNRLVNGIDISSDDWIDMISNRKISYRFILSNIKKILNICPKIDKYLFNFLEDYDIMNDENISPFFIKKIYNDFNKDLKIAKLLDNSINNSLSNVKFYGTTLIAIDVSKSMYVNSHYIDILVKMFSNISSIDIILVSNSSCKKLCDLDINYDMDTNLSSIKEVFSISNKLYDRFIIFSNKDFFSENNPFSELNLYKRKFNCDPFIYSIDIENNIESRIESNIFICGDISERLFDTINWFEMDRNKIYNIISNISI